MNFSKITGFLYLGDTTLTQARSEKQATHQAQQLIDPKGYIPQET